MKKVLLTSTALVAFAGAAAAEVKLSGWAEMGFSGGEGQISQFYQDVDVDFTLAGETPDGLVFGANVDLDEAAKLNDPFANQGVDIFVKGEFGTVTLGDTDGALDWAVAGTDTWGDPGTIADDETANWGWQDTYLDGSYDGQILRYDYTYQDFGFAVSVEQDDASDYELAGFSPDDDTDDRDRYDLNWAVGAKWSPEMGPGTLKLGIGYQEAEFGVVGLGLTDGARDELAYDLAQLNLTSDQIDALDAIFGFRPENDAADQLTVALGDGANVWAISAGYEMDNGFSFGGVYSDWDSDQLDNGEYWGIGAGYTFDAFSIFANYGQHTFTYSDDIAELQASGYGIAAGYDLGGGLSVLAGYGNSTYDLRIDDESVDNSFDTYSFGLSMSF